MVKIQGCGALLLIIACSQLNADEKPWMDKTDLFEANRGGYKTYRIPGVVVTKSGTLLAYCEARRSGTGDWEDIEVWMRRSEDGGKTWLARHRLADSGKDTVNNPVAIVDRSSGRIHFLYCIDYARCFYMFSDDDGRSFSQPREITSVFEAFRQEYDWNVIATGPGHGIQLDNDRLLVPVWISTGGKKHRPSAVSVIFSDDGGTTWQAGEICCQHPQPLVNPSETVAVQLSDGRVLMNIRNENSSYRRALSLSPDGAHNWSTVQLDEQLFEPICMAGLVHLPRPTASNDRSFVFSNPNSQQNPKTRGSWNFRYRENLTIRLSEDDCQSWPWARVLESGTSGYSDLAVGPDGTIYCLYERGGDAGFALQYLTMARFNRAWIQSGE